MDAVALAGYRAGQRTLQAPVGARIGSPGAGYGSSVRAGERLESGHGEKPGWCGSAGGGQQERCRW